MKRRVVVADNPPERWNTFHIIQRDGDMTAVWLNGQLVVDNVKVQDAPPSALRHTPSGGK